MSQFNVDQVLDQIRVLSRSNTVTGSPAAKPDGEFSTLLKASLEQVNAYQQEAASLKTAYAMGDSNVDIPEVMVAIQKASVSFEAVTEVRNQLLNAYQEIMNMQV